MVNKHKCAHSKEEAFKCELGCLRGDCLHVSIQCVPPNPLQVGQVKLDVYPCSPEGVCIEDDPELFVDDRTAFPEQNHQMSHLPLRIPGQRMLMAGEVAYPGPSRAQQQSRFNCTRQRLRLPGSERSCCGSKKAARSRRRSGRDVAGQAVGRSAGSPPPAAVQHAQLLPRLPGAHLLG